ncbi:chaperonin 10-like protein [Ampelomyces quisqualis]|uniref:Chaperonin 10-like protein n=1 Tax=Ampelomyces quisqualis TaxID=50730 RepID=A0A6A5QVS8_AMPQU|nr:chaperonin 10-like protein [Ampelomyces quisqualis]
MSTTIRKAVYSAAGGPEVVSIVTTQIVEPAANEVQVKVLYAGMGGGDIMMRVGCYPQQKDAAGLNPGYSLIGRVCKNGSRCSKFKAGDLVACLTVYDAHAELCNCQEQYLIPVPEGLDMRQAVAMITDWTTAYGMAYRTAKIIKGTRVFIHGLSGSVGYGLLTLCKMQGAEIYGTASEKNHAAVREAGATPFTYSNKDWMTAMIDMGGAEVVFDPLGFESWDESWKILAPEGGHLIGYGGNLDVLNGRKPRSQIPQVAKLIAKGLVPFCPKKTSFFYIDKSQKTFAPELTMLFGMLANGEVTVPIRKEWTLEQYPEAHRTWQQGAGIGAVVVKVALDSKD